MPEPVRIGICSTYAPRACGLATFAADLENALRVTGQVADVFVIAMVDAPCSGHGSDYLAAPVIAEIVENDVSTYVGAARRANASCDVVIVQHEFGIFGGDEGEFVLRFLEALTVPTVLTLHTVLSAFSPKQATLLRTACELVDVVTVFTPTASELLVRQRIVDVAKIRVVPHGAPSALYEAVASEARSRLGLEGRFVVSTFGLVSPGKGLELAIDAMRQVAAVVPSALLVVAGRTHPGENRRHGERYRSSLVDQVDRLGLGEHVLFLDSFLAVEEIADVLAATDVFVTPYINSEQIVSGALTFAIASGCPVVSTGYLYARDLLASGAGTVVESRRPEHFAEAILRYATDDHARLAAAAEAARIGAGMRWTAVGLEMVGIADSQRNRGVEALPRVVKIDRVRSPLMGHRGHTVRPFVGSPIALSGSAVASRDVDSTSTGSVLSPVPLRHLQRLVDGTGVVQHATGIVPLLSSGYCVDDVARLIPVAYRFDDDAYWARVTARGVAFIANAADPNGVGLSERRGDLMHNFMGFDRSWIDRPSFGDHVGRAAVGLSAVVHDDRYAPVCEPILRSMFRDLPHHQAIHPVGYVLLAQAAAPWLTTRDRTAELVGVMSGHLLTNTKDSWCWFEESVRYDAGLFVEALLAGGAALDDDRAVDAALGALRWLDATCDQGDHMRFPGHLGMGPNVSTAGTGDEQPLEALGLVRAYARAWEITGDRWFRDRAVVAHAWFGGRNRLGVPIADPDGGSFDGLCSHGVNRNQGAESTLAYVASALVIERIHRTVAAIPSSTPASGQ